MSEYQPTAFSSETVAQLRGLIARYDVNQSDLAELCNVSQSQFSKIIRGVRPMTLDQFVTICDALQLSVEEIVSESTSYVADRALRASPVTLVQDGDRLHDANWIEHEHQDPWAQQAADRITLDLVQMKDEMDVDGLRKDDVDLVANDTINETPDGTDADYDNA